MYVLIWSLVTDDNERFVGPFPTRKDAEQWGRKYMADDEQVTWSVKSVTTPAQYPVLIHTKSDMEIIGMMEEELLDWEEGVDVDQVYDRR